jgi:hypothetical protein
MIASVILPLLGVGIVIVCLLSFLFPYGEQFRSKVQKIKGFGVDLEVSVLTLFIIVGVALSLTGVYLQVKGYETELQSAKKDRDAAEQALRLARKMQISAFVTLKGLSAAEMPKLEDVECRYFLVGRNEPLKAVVAKGMQPNQFSVVFDITPDTFIVRLVIEQLSTKRRWSVANFSPIQPWYELAKED